MTQTVFVGSDDRKLYAVDASTGIEQWNFTTTDQVYTSPAVSRDGATVFVSSYDGKLYAVDASTGVQKWRSVITVFSISSPALSRDGATVFVGSADSNLYAVDASTGIEKWSFTTGDEVWSGPVVSHDGATVFVGSFDGNLYAVDKAAAPLRDCTGVVPEACPLNDPSTWCCNLEVLHCVCQMRGTVDEIRQLCGSMPNDGINCKECKAAPRCRA